MNFKNEHGQSILGRTSLGWTSLEERRAVMQAKLMYKTVNHLSLFSTWRLCSRDAKRKQESGDVIGEDWLAKKFAANK